MEDWMKKMNDLRKAYVDFVDAVESKDSSKGEVLNKKQKAFIYKEIDLFIEEVKSQNNISKIKNPADQQKEHEKKKRKRIVDLYHEYYLFINQFCNQKQCDFLKSRILANFEIIERTSFKTPAIKEECKKHKHSNLRAQRIKNSTPDWLKDRPEIQNQIDQLHADARQLTIDTGIKFAVDHIYPITHDDQTGLHLPWNMQIISKSENSSKSNRLPNDPLSFHLHELNENRVEPDPKQALITD